MKPSERIDARAEELDTDGDTANIARSALALALATLEYLDETHSPAQADGAPVKCDVCMGWQEHKDGCWAVENAVPPADDEGDHPLVVELKGKRMATRGLVMFNNENLETLIAETARAIREAQSRGEAVMTARVEDLEAQLVGEDRRIRELESKLAEREAELAKFDCKECGRFGHRVWCRFYVEESPATPDEVKP